MLPSWQSKLAITLAPAAIKLVHSKRGWRTGVQATQARIPVTSAGSMDWRPALGALDGWLRENNRVVAQARVATTVADCYARYALVPWPRDGAKPSELATYARLHVESLFGTTDADWQIRTDWERYGEPGIACALDQQLVAALGELFGKYNLRLTSLCPHFVAVFNQWRTNVVQTDVLLVVADSGQCTFARLENKQWRSIRSIRMPGVEAQVGAAIEREIVLQGLAEEVPVYIHMGDAAASGTLPRLRNMVTPIGSPAPTQAAAVMSDRC